MGRCARSAHTHRDGWRKKKKMDVGNTNFSTSTSSRLACGFIFWGGFFPSSFFSLLCFVVVDVLLSDANDRLARWGERQKSPLVVTEHGSAARSPWANS